MKPKTLYLFLIVLAALAMSTPGCKRKTITWKAHTVDNLYKIEVPTFMTEDPSLNELASFEYGSRTDDLYCIVISENMQHYIDSGYQILALDTIAEKMNEQYRITKGVKIVRTIPIRINNVPAILSTFEKIVHDDLSGKDVATSMEYAIIRGNNTLYQIMVWTTQDRKAEYSEACKRIIGSFRELSQKR